MLVRRDEAWPGIALLACIALKLVIETLHGMPSSPSFVTLSLVHYTGAVGGCDQRSRMAGRFLDSNNCWR
jgi:hypothetical protein